MITVECDKWGGVYKEHPEQGAIMRVMGVKGRCSGELLYQGIRDVLSG